ncbi:MAG: hypothetical protein U1F56_11090 [Rubrivivax sp.]
MQAESVDVGTHGRARQGLAWNRASQGSGLLAVGIGIDAHMIRSRDQRGSLSRLLGVVPLQRLAYHAA